MAVSSWTKMPPSAGQKRVPEWFDDFENDVKQASALAVTKSKLIAVPMGVLLTS